MFINTLYGNYKYGSIVKKPNDKKYYSHKNVGDVQPQYEYKNSNHYCNNFRHGGYTKANIKHGPENFRRSNKHHHEYYYGEKTQTNNYHLNTKHNTRPQIQKQYHTTRKKWKSRLNSIQCSKSITQGHSYSVMGNKINITIEGQLVEVLIDIRVTIYVISQNMCTHI